MVVYALPSSVVCAAILCCLLVTGAVAYNETGDGLTCYECNVWKAGYGNLCEAPRIRDRCYACMKIETTVFMGFYKNTPRVSTIISRTCATSKAVPYHTGCHYYSMSDGHNVRCYCMSDYCNDSAKFSYSTVAITLSSVVAVISSLLKAV